MFADDTTVLCTQLAVVPRIANALRAQTAISSNCEPRTVASCAGLQDGRRLENPFLRALNYVALSTHNVVALSPARRVASPGTVERHSSVTVACINVSTRIFGLRTGFTHRVNAEKRMNENA